MFICKKFSENLTYENDKNKGLIVESIYQKGTTFSFILENKNKLSKDRENAINTLRIFPTTCFLNKKKFTLKNYLKQTTKPNILIVDDNEFNVYSL